MVKLRSPVKSAVATILVLGVVGGAGFGIYKKFQGDDARAAQAKIDREKAEKEKQEIEAKLNAAQPDSGAIAINATGTFVPPVLDGGGADGLAGPRDSGTDLPHFRHILTPASRPAPQPGQIRVFMEASVSHMGRARRLVASGTLEAAGNTEASAPFPRAS